MNKHKSTTEEDINDVFDKILLSEEHVIEEAYKEGFSLGLAQGNPDGYHLGYHRGAELGAEIGYYSGITDKYLDYYEKATDGHDKIINGLKGLKELLDSFPRKNSEDIDILELMNQIRAKFKKIFAQIKVDVHYTETDTLSF